jgi:hypothetical protein
MRVPTKKATMARQMRRVMMMPAAQPPLQPPPSSPSSSPPWSAAPGPSDPAGAVVESPLVPPDGDVAVGDAWVDAGAAVVTGAVVVSVTQGGRVTMMVMLGAFAASPSLE